MTAVEHYVPDNLPEPDSLVGIVFLATLQIPRDSLDRLPDIMIQMGQDLGRVPTGRVPGVELKTVTIDMKTLSTPFNFVDVEDTNLVRRQEVQSSVKPKSPASATTRLTETSAGATERMFSIKEIAEFWPQSMAKLRRLFRHEPGVEVIDNPRPGKRSYQTIMVPESVLLAVRSRHKNQPLKPLGPLLHPTPVMLRRDRDRSVSHKNR